MDFKNWLAWVEQAIGPPLDTVLPKENPANAGVGAFPTYSRDEEPPTPSSRRRMRRGMKKR